MSKLRVFQVFWRRTRLFLGWPKDKYTIRSLILTISIHKIHQKNHFFGLFGLNFSWDGIFKNRGFKKNPGVLMDMSLFLGPAGYPSDRFTIRDDFLLFPCIKFTKNVLFLAFLAKHQFKNYLQKSTFSAKNHVFCGYTVIPGVFC